MSGKVHVRAQVLFAMVPEWVMDAEISAQAVRLYAVLARLGGEKRVAEGYTHREIADRARASVSTVRRALEELEAIRAVDVNENVDGRGRRENDYFVRVVLDDAVRSSVDTPHDPDSSPVNGQAQSDVGAASEQSGSSTGEQSRSLTGEQSKEPNPTPEKRKNPERGKPRKEDPAFEALARVTGKNARAMTEAEKKQTGVALAQIVAAEKARLGVETVERPELVRAIQHAAVQYRRLHPTWERTPFALVLHWSELFGDVKPAAVSPFDGHAFEASTRDPDSVCKTCGEAAYRHVRSLEDQREDRDAAAELAAHVRIAVEDQAPGEAVSS